MCFRTDASIFRLRDLAALTINPSPLGLIAAEPNPFPPDSQGPGETTVSWLAHGTSKVEVRLGAPDGLFFARPGPGRSLPNQPVRWVR